MTNKQIKSETQTPCTHLVHEYFDGANIGGTNRSVRKEAILPVTIVHDPLVEVEKSLEPPGHTGIHTEQLARKVAPVVDVPVGRRVESVVVARRQVNHAVVQAVLFRIVQDILLVELIVAHELIWGQVFTLAERELNLGVPFSSRPVLGPEEAFERIVDALDLLQHASVHLAKVEDATIARIYQTAFGVNAARVWLQCSAKEFREVLEFVQVVYVDLVEVAAE